MKFLHTSDWQLGMTRHFFGSEAQADYASARLEAVRATATLAGAEGCAFCVVAGDVFESNQVDRRTVARALDALDAFSMPVLLLPGNHDAYDAASVYRSSIFLEHLPDRVTVLSSSAPIAVGDGSVDVVGAPWTSRRPVRDLVADAVGGLEAAQGVRRVVVGHGQIREGHPNPDDPALVSLARIEEAIDEGTVHYVALGDRHSVTSHGKSGRVWHSGTPVQTDYDERDPNKVLVVDLDDEGAAAVTPRRVGGWSFVRRTFQLGSSRDVEAMSDWLEALPGKQQTVVKLGLVGALSLSASRALDDVLEHYGSVFAAVETWERRSELVTYANEQDLAELDVSGFAKRAVDRLDHLARSDEPRAGAAADALRLVYRLANGASDHIAHGATTRGAGQR